MADADAGSDVPELDEPRAGGGEDASGKIGVVEGGAAERDARVVFHEVGDSGLDGAVGMAGDGEAAVAME